MTRDEEQNRAAFCHFFNAVPIWGLLFNAYMWFDSREKSRHVEDQAREAMMFHGGLLAALVVLMVVELFTLLLRALFEPLGFALHAFNQIVVIGLVVGYIAFCIWGGSETMRGREFHYPFVRSFRN